MSDDEPVQRRRLPEPDGRAVYTHREDVGQVSQAGVVSPLGTSLLATAINRAAVGAYRLVRRLRNR